VRVLIAHDGAATEAEELVQQRQAYFERDGVVSVIRGPAELRKGSLYMDDFGQSNAVLVCGYPSDMLMLRHLAGACTHHRKPLICDVDVPGLAEATSAGDALDGYVRRQKHRTGWSIMEEADGLLTSRAHTAALLRGRGYRVVDTAAVEGRERTGAGRALRSLKAEVRARRPRRAYHAATFWERRRAPTKTLRGKDPDDYTWIDQCPVCGGGRFRRHLRHRGWELVVCAGCGLIITNPRPSDRLLEGVYADGRYRAHEFGGGGQREHLAAQAEDFRGLLRGQVAGHVDVGRALEVGCGAGNRLAVCRDEGWDAFGVDPNESAAGIVKSRFLCKRASPGSACSERRAPQRAAR
jgi:hypothetical protein